jgi:hypothetical protein
MTKLTTPIPAPATATNFDVTQLSLHDNVQRVGITIALNNDAGVTVRTVHRVFAYADLGVTGGMTLVQLRNAAIAAMKTQREIN